jgi:hypothetical protein
MDDAEKTAVEKARLRAMLFVDHMGKVGLWIPAILAVLLAGILWIMGR